MNTSVTNLPVHSEEKEKEANHALEASLITVYVILAIGLLVSVWTIALNDGGAWWIAFGAAMVLAIVFGTKAKRRLEQLVRLSRESKNGNDA